MKKNAWKNFRIATTLLVTLYKQKFPLEKVEYFPLIYYNT
jgi:hypothetical protein